MATFCNMAYTWDANKNKTSESITGVMSGYGFTSAGTTYDFEDRLTGFSRAATSGPALLSQSWNLTSVGDWTSVTTNGTAQNRTHGPTHELLTAGGQNVATDVKGNITTLPANLRPTGATTAMNLTWDSDNKLRSADIDANGTADVNFQYDALGRRVARSGTGGSVVFVQMDQQTIADYPVGVAATTPTFRYVYASYIDEPVVRKGPTSTSTVHFYHRNHQYSVTAITTSTGAVAELYAYTAYGQPTILDASGTVLQTSNFSLRTSYTGREWDATLGLHHFRARWMSPSAGRFLGRDPIGYEDGLDLYAMQVSLDAMDPLGLLSVVPKDPDPDSSVCTETITGFDASAECTVAGYIWGTRTFTVPCPSQDFQKCCQDSAPNEKIFDVEGILNYQVTTECSQWIEEPPLEAGIPIRVLVRMGCSWVWQTTTKVVRKTGSRILQVTKSSRQVTSRVTKTIAKRCSDFCKRYGSIPYEPDKGGTARHRTACAKTCLRAGLPCPLLKAWCNTLSGVEQEVCNEYYEYTCGRVGGG